MSKYQIEYSCGHTGRVQIYGATKLRQSRADWLAKGICPDCRREKIEREREKKNEDALRKAKERNYAELAGTPKQVAWAESIRADFIQAVENADKNYDEGIKADYLKGWIDAKGGTLEKIDVDDIKRRLIDKLARESKASKIIDIRFDFSNWASNSIFEFAKQDAKRVKKFEREEYDGEKNFDFDRVFGVGDAVVFSALE